MMTSICLNNHPHLLDHHGIQTTIFQDNGVAAVAQQAVVKVQRMHLFCQPHHQALDLLDLQVCPCVCERRVEARGRSQPNYHEFRQLRQHLRHRLHRHHQHPYHRYLWLKSGQNLIIRDMHHQCWCQNQFRRNAEMKMMSGMILKLTAAMKAFRLTGNFQILTKDHRITAQKAGLWDE